jgi:hypothetical protein
MTTHAEQWGALMQDMARLERDLLAVAPASDLARAEATRYLGRLLRYAIGKYLDQSASAMRPRLSYETARIGGDNPDYRYCIADLDGRLRYRLAGQLHDAYRLGIGTYSGGLGTAPGLQCTGYINIDASLVDNQGRFELVLSTGPAAGNRLPMAAETNRRIIRQLVLDPIRHQPATLEIECLSSAGDIRPHHTTAADLQAGLAQVNQFLVGTVHQFIRWTTSFMQHPNELRPLDPALLGAAQGDPSTHYFNGYYQLQPDEALIIEFTPPPCDYWNLQACNHWLESLDVQHHPAHINHYTAKAGSDGRVRAVITPTRSGVDNWIDTVGHREGCLAMRWVGLADGHQPPPLQCYVAPVSKIEK